MSDHDVLTVDGLPAHEKRQTTQRHSVKPWVTGLRHLLLVCSGVIALLLYAVFFFWLFDLSLGRAWLLAIAALGAVLGFAMSALLGAPEVRIPD